MFIAINDVETEDATDGHITADEMDEKRKQSMAYEYLCHLEEAKKYVIQTKPKCLIYNILSSSELE